LTELQQSRYDQLLRRVGDLKGPGSKLNDALEELFPTIDVENVPGELLFLSGTLLAYAGAVFQSSVGDIQIIQLFNPDGSGKLVTLTTLTVSGASQQLELGISATELASNPGVQAPRDVRAGVLLRPTASLRESSQVGGIADTLQLQALNNVTLTLSDPNGVAVLSPGTGFSVQSTLTATQLIVNFFWRERVAEPSELNF